MIFCRLQIFFQNIFFKININHSIKQNVGPDLGPTCLQWLLADNKIRRYQGESMG